MVKNRIGIGIKMIVHLIGTRIISITISKGIIDNNKLINPVPVADKAKEVRGM